MKFVVSSTDLLSHLQAINRVINSKNTLPILDNFLFNLTDKTLEITATDLETTMITHMELENVSEEGSLAIPARILMDTLKEFPEQPLTFNINVESFTVVLSTENGEFTIVGQNAEDFPNIPTIKEEQEKSVRFDTNLLLNGISKTIFATAEDEMRPVMNGVFLELDESQVTFVASDAHKLVRYIRTDITPGVQASLILPKKPASLLRNILLKEDGDVNLSFDDKNAAFELPNYRLICRLTEGNYPSYSTVIPDGNDNHLIIDRVEFLNTLRRVSVFANQASQLVKLSLKGNQITVSAQDIDFSISAYENIKCQYDSDEMEIGFKSIFLQEILSNISSEDVRLELSDPSQAGLVIPTETEGEEEDVLMLLMPMMIGN